MLGWLPQVQSSSPCWQGINCFVLCKGSEFFCMKWNMHISHFFHSVSQCAARKIIYTLQAEWTTSAWMLWALFCFRFFFFFLNFLPNSKFETHFKPLWSTLFKRWGLFASTHFFLLQSAVFVWSQNLPVLFTFLTHPPGLLPPRVPSALYMSRQIYLSIMTPASSVCREFQMNASASRREPLAGYHARDQIKAPALCGASLSRQLIIKSSHHTPHLFPGP